MLESLSNNQVVAQKSEGFLNKSIVSSSSKKGSIQSFNHISRMSNRFQNGLVRQNHLRNNNGKLLMLPSVKNIIHMKDNIERTEEIKQ